MATGTGKTRTTMGLIDLFLQSSWVQKVLFLADRDALVEQALNDGFKAHLPNEPRIRIRTANIDPSKRLYVATRYSVRTRFVVGAFARPSICTGAVLSHSQRRESSYARSSRLHRIHPEGPISTDPIHLVA